MRERCGEIVRRATQDPVQAHNEVVIEIMGAFGDFGDFGFEVFHRLVAHGSRIGGYSEGESRDVSFLWI